MFGDNFDTMHIKCVVRNRIYMLLGGAVRKKTAQSNSNALFQVVSSKRIQPIDQMSTSLAYVALLFDHSLRSSGARYPCVPLAYSV